MRHMTSVLSVLQSPNVALEAESPQWKGTLRDRSSAWDKTSTLRVFPLCLLVAAFCLVPKFHGLQAKPFLFIMFGQVINFFDQIVFLQKLE